jgi:hypothetical protein
VTEMTAAVMNCRGKANLIVEFFLKKGAAKVVE